MNISAQLEAVLFYKAEPLSVKHLSEIVGVDKKSVEDGLNMLEEKLKERGVVLIRNKDEIELRTAPDASALIEKLSREELSRELGKAGAETLAIILYSGGAARKDIDWIRGVNSSFIIRELCARGLVSRSARDKRGFVYEPTAELLAHLGAARAEDLPDFSTVKKEMESFVAESRQIS
jgi:segregation and condensation protein B